MYLFLIIESAFIDLKAWHIQTSTNRRVSRKKIAHVDVFNEMYAGSKYFITDNVKDYFETGAKNVIARFNPPPCMNQLQQTNKLFD